MFACLAHLVAIVALAAPSVSDAPAPAVAPARLPLLLVLPLRAEMGVESAARALDEMLVDAVAGLGRYKVIGASDLNAMLGVEKLKDAAGCDDVACAAELGGALGAPFLVAGHLGRLGEQAVLSLRLIDAKAAQPLARASARGIGDAEGLASLLEQAVATLFGLPPPAVKPRAIASPPGGAAVSGAGLVNPYEAYAQAAALLGRRMSNYEYTALLKDLDAYDAAPMAAPPGQDAHELFTFYRVTACFMLKRAECLRAAATRYREKWPGGTYANGVQSYLTQLEDEALQREAKQRELVVQRANVASDRLRNRGNAGFDEPASYLAEGYACLGSYAFDEAARVFADLLNRVGTEAQWFEAAEGLLSAYERAGRFDEARALLDRAEAKNATTFRLRGMHLTRQRLPK